MNKEQITITLVQMNVSLGSPEKNLARVEKLLDPVSKSSDIILLPELWSSGYDYENLPQMAATTPTPWVRTLANSSRPALPSLPLSGRGEPSRTRSDSSIRIYSIRLPSLRLSSLRNPSLLSPSLRLRSPPATPIADSLPPGP